MISLIRSSSSLLLFNNNNNRLNRYISDLINRISLNDRSNNIIAKFNNNNTSSSSSRSSSITYGELNNITTNISNYINNNHKDVNIIGSYHYGELGYILSMIGSWKSNLTFVPLSTSHPEQELKYFVDDSNMGLLLHSLGNVSLVLILVLIILILHL
jgi:acyl-CoA synthetase (AMP-forming)/AMP-acid ligase II